MTSDNLLKFLGNREYLHQVSYQELKSMVVQYPYSLSLRYLLAMKSQQENHTDLDRNIELLATYGIDRAHLHRIFSEDPIVLEDLEENLIMGEDFLELKELSALERELDDQLVTTENIAFIEETIPSLQNSRTKSINTLPPPPPVIVEEIAESIEVAETTELIPDTANEELATTNNPPEINPKETGEQELLDSTILDSEEESKIQAPDEEYVELDFESEAIPEEAVGLNTERPEVAPSESYVAQNIEFDENGLPADAIEVNDLFVEKEEQSLADLFNESEQEVIAEEAVSDSMVFIEHPEEVLVKESQAVFEEEIVEAVVEDAQPKSSEESPSIEEKAPSIAQPIDQPTQENQQLSPEKSETENEISLPRPQIPFEVNYSSTDPIPVESPEELVKVVPSTKSQEVSTSIQQDLPSNDLSELNTEGISTEKANPQEKEIPSVHKEETPLEPTFKFDSLEKFENKLNKERLVQYKKPRVLANKWQEKYSGVSQFSSINLALHQKTTGKVIRKKKKVVKKKFNKTVALAEESLRMGENIASETLAQLLVEQGHYDRARAMYEELSLIMPEKSVFFAGEIKKIQNLPKEDS